MTTTVTETVDPSLWPSLWTDEQESALLHAIVRWKPVGIHKHFRMIAIRDHLLSQNVTSAEDPHTTIAGIWAKLSTLYDLPKLDERENATVDISDDPENETLYFRDFELPREDFEEMMWQKRLAPDGTQSPEWSRRGSTVADTDEPRSSPIPAGSARGGRKTRRGRSSRLQNEVETDRSSRRTSKANSAADEDQTMDDAADEEEDEQATGDDEESEEEEEPEEKKGSTRGGRGGRRGRGRRGRRGR
ncbi:uncharacterized protein PV06_03829 [Exophiala oligosperma]|uniref:Chromatin modification-related protein EAF7 n=2 Tax=Chaetothyriales TaxID=34395 RepID=A0A0D2C6N0_9EURO|nr:uncharacterized protein PV06_03829 [Exophiala oligosperma]KAJ9610097.1 hypothetical protein H2204_015487 [Knufia peltigerae]KIW45437.1 hypothetical protein PV06_03829 [Exophiala oligosperma]